MIRFWRSGTSATPISTPRSPRATMIASVSSRICVEDGDSLGLLDLGDHVGVRAGLLDQQAQVANVRSRADERERDVVDPELQGELEIADVLRSQRRDRQRNAGQVDTLVRRDGTADDDGAACPPILRPPRRAGGRGRRRSARRSRARARRRSPPARPAGRRRCTIPLRRRRLPGHARGCASHQDRRCGALAPAGRRRGPVGGRRCRPRPGSPRPTRDAARARRGRSSNGLRSFPRATSSARRAGVPLAGPIVARILVRRCSGAAIS